MSRRPRAFAARLRSDPLGSPWVVLALCVLAGALGVAVALHPIVLKLAEAALAAVCVVSAVYLYLERRRRSD